MSHYKGPRLRLGLRVNQETKDKLDSMSSHGLSQSDAVEAMCDFIGHVPSTWNKFIADRPRRGVEQAKPRNPATSSTQTVKIS